MEQIIYLLTCIVTIYDDHFLSELAYKAITNKTFCSLSSKF